MNNFMRGWKAKGAGDSFEQTTALMCNRRQIIFIKIPDGCYRYKNKSTGRIELAACETPFDYLIAKNGRSAVFDCKTIEGSSFSFSDVTDHQVRSLMNIGQDLPAGYVIWFRAPDIVAFFTHLQLFKLRPRTGLKPDQGLLLGNEEDFDLELIFDLWRPTPKQQSLL